MEWISIFLALVACVLTVFYYQYVKWNYFKGSGVPYKTPVPLIGNFLELLLQRTSMPDILMKLYNAYPHAKYIGIFSMLRGGVMIRDPELIKLIAIKNFDSFPNRRVIFDPKVDEIVGNNLSVLEGDKWREVRTLLSPSFSTAKIKAMFKLMDVCAREFVQYLTELPVDQREMDMITIFPKVTNDVVATCAFGVKVDSMRDPDNSFFKHGKQLANFGRSFFLKIILTQTCPQLMRLLNVRFFSKESSEFFENVVREIVETREKEGITRPDMIQVMMDSRGKTDRNDITIKEMTSQAFLFFFAGYATTASAMCAVAHELGMNQEAQTKLQEEIDKVLEKTSGKISYEDVNELEYLDAVITEALRMHPVAAVADRVCGKDFQLPPAVPGAKPYTLKAGMDVWFPMIAIQRDPKIFEEPEKFRPERFVGNKKLQNTGEYIPFGLGPRMCIANRFVLVELKILFFILLARCSLRPCSKTQHPLKWSKSKPLLAEGGFWMRIEPREATPFAPVPEQI